MTIPGNFLPVFKRNLGFDVVVDEPAPYRSRQQGLGGRIPKETRPPQSKLEVPETAGPVFLTGHGWAVAKGGLASGMLRQQMNEEASHGCPC